MGTRQSSVDTEEIAREMIALFQLSANASYMTGASIPVAEAE